MSEWDVAGIIAVVGVLLWLGQAAVRAALM